MPLPEYVEWRGNRLQYRRAYPKDVWPIVGKGRAFTKSRRTDSPGEAMRACPEAARAYYVAVDEARGRLAQLANRPPITTRAAEALAVKWFLEALETGETFRLPMSPDALDDALEFSSDRAADARQALAEGDVKDWKRRAAELRDGAGGRTWANLPGAREAKPYGGHKRKLTEADVRAIRQTDEPDRVLAERYGVTASNINAIRKRVSWKHVS
jgi:hypothetical protein